MHHRHVKSLPQEGSVHFHRGKDIFFLSWLITTKTNPAILIINSLGKQ